MSFPQESFYDIHKTFGSLFHALEDFQSDKSFIKLF